MLASDMYQTIALAMFAAIGLQAQPSDPAPRFEVASLKASETGSGIIRPAPGGQRYLGSGVTLKLMIQTAYRVGAAEVVGGPDWINRDRFDLEAKAERASSAEELRAMLKHLLAERFQLQFRRETKELPVYVLTVDTSGPKVTPRQAQDGGDEWISYSLDGGRPLHIKLQGTAASMDYLVWRMRQFVDRPMIDQTGLKGGYDFNLTFTMQAPPSMHEGQIGHDGVPIDFSGPTIFEALRKQMGLRLADGKRPVEVMVIDRAEKLKEN